MEYSRLSSWDFRSMSKHVSRNHIVLYAATTKDVTNHITATLTITEKFPFATALKVLMQRVHMTNIKVIESSQHTKLPCMYCCYISEL